MKPERFACEAHIPRGSGDAHYIIVDGAEHVALCDEQEHAERLVKLLNAAGDLLNALTLALPYVEMISETDSGYKPGAARKMAATMRAAIEQAESRP